MGMGVIHGQQAGSHCGFEKFSPLRGPQRFRIKFFKICILAKRAPMRVRPVLSGAPPVPRMRHACGSTVAAALVAAVVRRLAG